MRHTAASHTAITQMTTASVAGLVASTVSSTSQNTVHRATSGR